MMFFVFIAVKLIMPYNGIPLAFSLPTSTTSSMIRPAAAATATWVSKGEDGGYYSQNDPTERNDDWDGDEWPAERGGTAGNYDYDDRSSAERPFSRANDSYWSSGEYSSPNFGTRRGAWDDRQQQDYRKSKYNRNPQWPQGQTYGGGQESGFSGQGQRPARNDDAPNSFDRSWQQQRQPGQQRGDGDDPPPLRRGSNTGEQQTESSRRGSGSAREQYNHGDGAPDESRGDEPLRRGGDRREQNRGGYFDRDENSRGGENYHTRGQGNYYNNPPLQSSPPPPKTKIGNTNDYGRMGEQQYGTVVNSFDRRRQPVAGSKAGLEQRRRQQGNDTFDQRSSFPQYESNTRQQYVSSPQYYPSEPPSGDSFGGDEPHIRFGNGGIKRMVKRLIKPFDAYLSGRTDQMMDRVNSEMTRSMAQEQKSTKALLSDARDYLLDNPVVKDMLGTDSIILGKPYSQSLSKTTVDGVTRSRLQLVIPIAGSDGTGRVRLLATQDEIMLLEVEVGGRIFNVPLDKGGSRSNNTIDANVEDMEIY